MNRFQARMTRIKSPTTFGELWNGEKFIVPTKPELNHMTFVKLDCSRAFAINGDEWLRPEEKFAVTVVETN